MAQGRRRDGGVACENPQPHSGGVSQQHQFEIIADLPYISILDCYVSQQADEHSRAPFLFNLLPCWTPPPQELMPRPFEC
jgi:hypothetical protein